MDFFESNYFTYKNNTLYCEDISLTDISHQIETPFYVYSKKYLYDNYSKFEKAFEGIKHKIFYACKANYNINIIKLFNDLGAGIDVNSAGEFHRALKASVDPQNMIFSGVGKTREEIKLALENNIHMLKAESLSEIELINEVGMELGKNAPVAIRVNPNVDPATHPYISTGLAENKFGIDETAAVEIFRKAASLSNIEVVGIDMHIGSQITKVEPYVEAITKLVELKNKLKTVDISITHIDIGGGMGIRYFDEKPFLIDDFAKAIIPVLSKADCEIFMEPGRILTANAGALITKVLYKKTNLDKNFLVVDAAMNDNLRPSLYKAYHHIQPVKKTDKVEFTADIVGPICESGDFLGKQRVIQEVDEGDLLSLMSAGAYGIVMSSNYNARRRPPELLVDGNKFHIIRERETFDQLMQNEKIIQF